MGFMLSWPCNHQDGKEVKGRNGLDEVGGGSTRTKTQ